MLNPDVRIAQELDAIGLRCPLPLLKAKQAMNQLAAGAVLKVKASDPGSKRDFQAWSQLSGHDLLCSDEQQGVYIYVLRKKY